MKYIIRVMPYGWYTGRSKKYHDMFQCSAKEFAKKFDSKEEAERIANPLLKVGYDVTIVEIEE